MWIVHTTPWIPVFLPHINTHGHSSPALPHTLHYAGTFFYAHRSQHLTLRIQAPQGQGPRTESQHLLPWENQNRGYNAVILTHRHQAHLIKSMDPLIQPHMLIMLVLSVVTVSPRAEAIDSTMTVKPNINDAHIPGAHPSPGCYACG